MGSIALGSCFRIARSYLSCKREFFWKFVVWHSSELELEAGRKVLFTSPITQSLIAVRNTFSSNNSANSDPLPLDSVTQALGSAATVVGLDKKISHSCGQPNIQNCLPPKSVNVLLCRETSTTKEVLAIVWAQGHCKSFPKINLATALHRIAILSSQADFTHQLRDDLFRHKAFHYLLTVMKEGMPQMSTWSIGIALWSFGRLQYIPSTHPTLIEDLVKALAKPENRASVTDREVALCVWGLGTLGLQPEPSLMPCYEELICHTLRESMRKGSTGPVKVRRSCPLSAPIGRGSRLPGRIGSGGRLEVTSRRRACPGLPSDRDGRIRGTVPCRFLQGPADRIVRPPLHLHLRAPLLLLPFREGVCANGGRQRTSARPCGKRFLGRAA
mmetsp:Transcript_28893/g.69027  ORF Transcript_28893/g.69027 Transcript_28893/m.69027 type:complete len:386 (-) Transcript_28893:9-1166(-)